MDTSVSSYGGGRHRKGSDDSACQCTRASVPSPGTVTPTRLVHGSVCVTGHTVSGGTSGPSGPSGSRYPY